ncbi:ANKRD50, partial [Symbiodinium necroappetens]
GEKAKEEDSLVEAAGRGDLNKVEEFLAVYDYDPNYLEIGKETSRFAPEPSEFRRLAETRGLPRDGKSLGTTALIAAAVSGHSHVARELLKFGADVDATDSDGLTALIAAAVLGHSHVARELLKFGADVDATDSDGLTALSAAFCSPNCDIHMWFLLHHAVDQERKKTAQSSRMDEKRTLRMLVSLLRGEGQNFTEMVSGLLKEVEPGQFRSERLKERVRTVLCDYAWDTQGVQNFFEGRRKSMYGFADVIKKKSEDVDAFNLSWHNMLYAKEVQVSLRSLPIAAPLACKPSVLAALAETENEETLETEAVEAITAAAWLQMRMATAVDSFLNCVALGCLCLATWACRYGGMDAQPALWVLAIIQFKEAAELLSQLGFYCWSRLSRRRKERAELCRAHVDRVNGKDVKLLGDADILWVHPAPSLETLVDLLFLAAGSGAIYRQMDLCVNQELEPIFLPGFCSMCWLRLLYSLRGERWLGYYFLPILLAVRDTGPFFFVTSLCIASATHAYVIMNPRGEDDFPVYSAFTHTVRLAIFGDFDLFEYQGQDTTFEQVEGEWAPNDPSPKDLEQRSYIYLQFCFFCTGIGITVLLMNLLLWCMV